MSTNMDLLSLERAEFNSDYPMEPTPRADMWIAWNSEDGFTFWDNEKEATLWSADGSIEWPVRYVMQKAQPKFEALIRADEREACAKVCEQTSEEFDEGPDQWDWHSKDYAAAIRARGEAT